MRTKIKQWFLVFLISVLFSGCGGCGGGKKGNEYNNIKTSSLYISSAPSGATVILDNENKGDTPLTLNNVTVGSHSLKLTSELYKESSQTVVIEENKTTTINISLEPTNYPTNPW